MITLPAGNTKFLLLDTTTLARNTERSGRGSPAVIVAEINTIGDVVGLHRGYNAHSLKDAPVSLTVFPRGHRFQKDYYAAWTTAGEVVLDDAADGEEVAGPVTSKPAKPASPKPVKVKR